MANGAHLSRKGGNCFGFVVFAWAADSARSSRVRPPAPGPAPAGRLAGGSEGARDHFFYCCYCFTAKLPPPLLSLPVFSPPTAPLSSPPPPPAQLKERGSDAAASFIWGNSWLPQVYYPRRSQCLARRTRRAKHRGSGAEQYPPRARRRDPDSGGGSGRPRAQRRRRPASTRRPSAPAAVRWSCGRAGPGRQARSSPASFPRPAAWPAHGLSSRAPWPRRCTDFLLREPLVAAGPGVREAEERVSVCVSARVRAGVGAAALRSPPAGPPLRSAPHTSLLLPPPARPCPARPPPPQLL